MNAWKTVKAIKCVRTLICCCCCCCRQCRRWYGADNREYYAFTRTMFASVFGLLNIFFVVADFFCFCFNSSNFFDSILFCLVQQQIPFSIFRNAHHSISHRQCPLSIYIRIFTDPHIGSNRWWKDEFKFIRRMILCLCKICCWLSVRSLLLPSFFCFCCFRSDCTCAGLVFAHDSLCLEYDGRRNTKNNKPNKTVKRDISQHWAIS